MGFPLVPKWVTLNDLELQNGRYFALFHIWYLWGQLWHSGVVEVRRKLPLTQM